MIGRPDGTLEFQRSEWDAFRRDATRFLIVMCCVCGAVGFMLGVAACAITGAWS